ncbi:hypothetical protein [uncultured Pseudokineococcus sp.]|uniref:hypothetical protein n=1 Tax=uncultured Pseudokineococcus sp. TaxID=1642928 RepID=UPI0034361C9E
MKKTLALSAALALTALPLAGPAMAASSSSTELTGTLTQLNDSGATADVSGTVSDGELTLTITPSGLLENAPHAQHLHLGAASTCPSNDTEGSGADGALQTTDSFGDYGPIGISLTTEGDYSSDSGLAVDRFPLGNAEYDRTFEISDEVAQQILDGEGVVVIHGVDQNGSGTYDGDVMSDLDPTLPEEATNLAACGTLDVVTAVAAESESGSEDAPEMTMPQGGADTGVGGTAGGDSLLVAGGAAVVAAGAAGLVWSRRRAGERG